MALFVRVIVEGQGEVRSIETLFKRIWKELLQVDWDFIAVRAVRQPQGTLLQKEGLSRAVELAAGQLALDPRHGGGSLIVLLIDAEKQCPKQLAPQLLEWAQQTCSHMDIACVLPNPMYETWFVAAAASLLGVNDLPTELTAPSDVEGSRLGKAWIKKHLPRKYKETADQPRCNEEMDLRQCRDGSPSFDKLCRELEQRVPARPPPETPPDVEEQE
jgi:hypothetical protein